MKRIAVTLEGCANMADEFAQLLDEQWPRGEHVPLSVAMKLGELRVHLRLLSDANVKVLERWQA